MGQKSRKSSPAEEKQGRLSNHRRKQYADRVQPQAMDGIEQTVRRVFGFSDGPPAA
jgi:hypothetical protein